MNWVGLIDVRFFDFALPKGISMRALIESGQNTRPACGTDRRGDEGIFIINPFCSESIHLRGLDNRIPRKSQSIPTMIISQNKDDVRTILLRKAIQIKGKKEE